MGFIVAAASAVTSVFTSGGLITSALGRVALSVGLSLLSRALAPRPPRPGALPEPGLQIPGLEIGEDKSQSFVLGRHATAGHLVYRNSHGSEGGTPNLWLTHVIELSDIAGMTLESLVINDRPATITAGNWLSDLGFGRPVDGFPNTAFIHYRDGSQTDPIRPWQGPGPYPYAFAEFPDYFWSGLGRGLCYAILTFRWDRKTFQGVPQVLFVVSGIPLYDPRLDDTAGGAGPQRREDPGTWAPSSNPVVMIYNILRGIPLPTGEVWGGSIAPEDLPLANWVAAMTLCDTVIEGRAQFSAGLEVRVAQDEPAAVIERLLLACTGQISEFGGVWRIRVGAPAAAVMVITDDDLSISDPQLFEPIRGLEDTHNAISAQYVEPRDLWQARTTELITNPLWEAEDGDRRLPVELMLPGVTNRNQARQIAGAMIRDHRRQRQHQFVLPPEAQILEPLDTLLWTSRINGYDARAFEIQRLRVSQRSAMVAVTLRERDPHDHDWQASDELPLPPDYAPLPPAPPLALQGWDMQALSLPDAFGPARRPGLLFSWDGQGHDEIAMLEWQLAVETTPDLLQGFDTALAPAGWQSPEHACDPDLAQEASSDPIPTASDSAPFTLVLPQDILLPQDHRVVGLRLRLRARRAARPVTLSGLHWRGQDLAPDIALEGFDTSVEPWLYPPALVVDLPLALQEDATTLAAQTLTLVFSRPGSKSGFAFIAHAALEIVLARDMATGLARIAEGVLLPGTALAPDTRHHARARPLSQSRATLWTPWVARITPDLRLETDDLAEGAVSDGAAIFTPGSVSLPSAGGMMVDLVVLSRRPGHATDIRASAELTVTNSGLLDVSVALTGLAGAPVYRRSFLNAAGERFPVTLNGVDTDLSGGTRTYGLLFSHAPAVPGDPHNTSIAQRFLQARQIKR